MMALLFVSGQAAYFGVSDPARAVGHVRIGAWVAWAVALLLLLATGGGLFRSASVRALLNDESTRANRSDAFAWGFWAAMACAIGLYILSQIEPVTVHQAIHLQVTAGVGAALLRFAFLELRSLMQV